MDGPAPSCSLCCSSLGDARVVSCGDCCRVFHAERICLGVDQSVIDVLLNDNLGAVKYVCCKCRGSSSVGASSKRDCGMDQILNIIGCLVSDMKKLTESVSKLNLGQSPPCVVRESDPVVIAGNSDRVQEERLDRSTILSEVREIYEREKRKSSVILRGVGDISVQHAVEVFRKICLHLGLGNVKVVDIVKIAPSIFRGKIVENENRLKLLAGAPKLRRSDEFSRIYVQKDLTYRQRNELISKRAARRQTARSSPSEGPSTSNRTVLETDLESGNISGPAALSGANAVPMRSVSQGRSSASVRGARRGRPRGGRGARGYPPPTATRQSRRNVDLN